MVIRSEPFPEVTTSSPLVTPSGVSEEKKTLSTNAEELDSDVARQPLTSDSSSGVKKTSVEKKTKDDGDDPFGALDWKDGIATLPGNALSCCNTSGYIL